MPAVPAVPTLPTGPAMPAMHAELGSDMLSFSIACLCKWQNFLPQQPIMTAVHLSCFHIDSWYTGNKQPKVVRDSFEVFQDQGKKTGGTRAKGATAAGLPGTGLLKQGKPRAGMADTHNLTRQTYI